MQQKTLVNPNLVESITFVPQTPDKSFIWTEYYSWESFWTGKLKSKRAGWAWRRSDPDLLYLEPECRLEYKDDYELIKDFPNLNIEGKSLFTKPRIIIRYSSGKEEIKRFPSDDMALVYWDRLKEWVGTSFKNISEPKNYTDE